MRRPSAEGGGLGILASASIDTAKRKVAKSMKMTLVSPTKAIRKPEMAGAAMVVPAWLNCSMPLTRPNWLRGTIMVMAAMKAGHWKEARIALRKPAT